MTNLEHFLVDRALEAPANSEVARITLGILRAHPVDGGGWCGTCQDLLLGDQARWPCRTVRLVAYTYRHHPDYQAKWRP